MTPTITPTQDAVLTAVRSVLLTMGLVDSSSVQIPIVRGQVNRVPEPASPDFVVIWPIARERLAFNIDTWQFVNAPTTTEALQKIQVTFQADVHGPNSADNVTKISTLWRDQFAVSAFLLLDPNMAPLYTSDPKQMPFDNGEQQIEDRWVVDLVMQVNVTISTDQQYANQLSGSLVLVDRL